MERCQLIGFTRNKQSILIMPWRTLSIAISLNCLFGVLANSTSVDTNLCKVTHKGTEYSGKISTTKTGLTCQYWNSTGKGLVMNETFPEGSKTLAENYCRNPNGNPNGPWCYTSLKKLGFVNCDVPLCKSSDCRVAGPGVEYAGPIETSVSGKKCTRWTDKHKLNAHHKEAPFGGRLFPDGSAKEAGRKCRNPDSQVSGPWCYVEIGTGDLHEKELCDVPFCDDTENLMYSESSHSGQYFFYSSLNETQSLNISFRLWDPASWLHGQVFVYLSAYDIASERADIRRWRSGLEIRFSHRGSGITSQNCELKQTPKILSGIKWTNLGIQWKHVNKDSLLVQVFQETKQEPLAEIKTDAPNTTCGMETFRFISLGGSPAFWKIPSPVEDCPVHTVTRMKLTRFWVLKKSTCVKHVEVFIRAKENADIILRRTPMNDTKQVQVAFSKKNKIKILTYDDRRQSRQLAEVSRSNVLNFWKWEYFKIRLRKGKLELFWIREQTTTPLIEASHENIESVMWVSFRSPSVSYWTVYCDPRGSSDPPAPIPPECVSHNTEPFNGTLSSTRSGRQCIPWTDVDSLPKKYHNDTLFEPYGGRKACRNYCRNLDRDPKGAYCVVRHSHSESGYCLEHCHPRSCSLSDCESSGTGNDYTGHLDVTRSKRKCKPWAEVYDGLVDGKKFPDHTLEDAGNFCRNPDSSTAGTWCFTTDPRVPRDVCYIKDCDRPLECTTLTKGYKKGAFLYILPSWRKNGLEFAVKAWNPDIYEGLVISLFSLDRSKQYKLLIGDEDNEKLKLFYEDENTAQLLVQKTLPHLIPTGKWKGYWLRPRYGRIELGYQEVPTSFFEWSTPETEFAFKPMFISYGTTQNNWIGVNFPCSECLTTESTNGKDYKIYPVNLWNEDISTSKLLLNLRGSGSAIVTLLWTPDFQKLLAVQFVSNSSSILIVQYKRKKKRILASFPVSSTMTEQKWSEFIISFTETTITVHKGTIQLLEWVSPFPLLIYWFAVTAEGGAITWTANCPASDIDGEPRDGSWGKWGSWSCSVTCGKGEGRIERKCDDPPPNVFGDECKGSPVYEGPCNDFPCGKISPGTNSMIRRYLSSQHKSLQVDVSERVVLPCNSQARSLIAAEVSEMNITWTHNGFPYSRTRFHMDENYSLVIPRAQEKHCGIYLCMAYQDPDSIPSKIVLEVISLVVIKEKPTKKIRKGKSLTLKCNGLALSYVYADLSQRWELNGLLWKDYGLGNLQTFTVDKLENISDFHEGIWTCVIIQEDFKFKWTTNWIYIKVKSAPNFWSHLMEDVATAPLFGKLGNERNAMILFFALIGVVVAIILIIIIVLVKCLKK